MKAKVAQKPKMVAQVNELRERLDKAVAATARAFYEDILQSVGRCQDKSEEIRLLSEMKFRQEPGFVKLVDPPPSLFKLRTALQEYRGLVEDILKQKPSVATERVAAASMNGDPTSTSSPPAIVSFGEPQSRDAAIRQLVVIGQYLRRNDPHSPVACLTLRAARWAEMSIENLLAEILPDAAGLSRVKETLGIAAKDK